MRRFLALFAAVLVAGALIGLIARVWQPAGPPPAARTVRPETVLALEITRDGVLPRTCSVPKDHLVRLTVTNHHGHPVTLSLAGYEERLHPGPIPEGGSWSGTFIADRPGEDFAWLVDGEAAGRLQVTGSHLVEGHR